jgi:hypothetical protein
MDTVRVDMRCTLHIANGVIFMQLQSNVLCRGEPSQLPRIRIPTHAIYEALTRGRQCKYTGLKRCSTLGQERLLTIALCSRKAWR